MGSPCNLTSNGAYAVKHLPFLYYDNVQSDSARCAAHIALYVNEFSVDLGEDAEQSA